MIPYIFFTFAVALSAVYGMFLWRIRQGLKWLSKQPHDTGSVSSFPPVTVIVPVRNEQHAVESSLASLCGQKYPHDRLQIIIVDDHSEDSTWDLALRIVRNDDRFLLLRLTEGKGKKAAITEAVARATGEIVVTTDADCEHDPDWVKSMVAPFAGDVDVVAGPVVHLDRSTLFRRLQALEFLGLMGVGAGLFGVGYPRLCNGANMAYRRGAFARAQGYKGNDRVASGDDEFLLHKIVYAQGGNAEFVISQSAIVVTPPSADLRVFFSQRIRWASKGRHYADKRFVSFLVLLFLYMCCGVIAPAVALSGGLSFLLATVLFLLKLAWDTAVLFSAARLFRAPLRVADVFIAEILHPFYLVTVSFLGFFHSTLWKGRPLKQQ